MELSQLVRMEQRELLNGLKELNWIGEILEESIIENCGEPDGTQEWGDKANEIYEKYYYWIFGNRPT